MLNRILALGLLVSTVSLRADVVLAPPFADHAVLQRGVPLPVWGSADPGEEVTVSFASRRRAVRADADGRWRVELPALEADATPAELVVTGKNRVVLRDVVVGDVWLASGQSNMEMALGWGRVANGKAEAAAAKFPLIREIKIAKAVADTPRSTARGEWRVCSPATAGNFSAVGYFFARELHRELQVPVGIINCSWGGALIEPWISAGALARDPGGVASLKRWQDTLDAYPANKARYEAALAAWEKAKAAAAAEGREFRAKAPSAPVGPGHQHTRSGLYNAMIHPLAPFALRGVLWYQGESNIGRHDEYRTLLPTLIEDWRATFARPDLPFYWVQLPNYAGGNANGQEWARLREAQSQALRLPHTGQAVTIDIGDPKDIHPANKSDVGLRLARLALARTYGRSEVVDSGPVFDRVERDGRALLVRFRHAAGLAKAEGVDSVTGFEIAGSDKKFVSAEATIEPGGVVRVSAAAVAEPVAVRYLWRNDPGPALRNAEGLPAAPFRSDTW